MTLNAKNFWRCERGNFALLFAIVLPTLMLASGSVLNFSMVHSERTRLQSAADGAALAAAHELYLADTKPELLQAVAKSFVAANLGSHADGVDVSVTVGAPNGDTAASDPVMSEVTVALTADLAANLPLPDLTGSIGKATVTSVARVAGGGRICMIGLAASGRDAIKMSGTSRLVADRCAVYSDSVDPKGLSVRQLAKLSSELSCSSGGYDGLAINYDPKPLTDCPAVKDPLISRTVPAPTACDFSDVKVKDVNTAASPGVYCGKLDVSSSQLSLRPGTYVFWNAKVKVDKHSTISGDGVTLVFLGKKSGLDLKNDTEVALSASSDGPMAGILIYADSGSDKARDFKIESNNARKMVGTIYLPNDKLVIGGDKDGDGKCDPDPVTGLVEGLLGCKAEVGAFSDWTAIVASQVEITAGVHLILNTNYDGSSVPVPAGVGPVGGNIRLAE